MGCDVARMSEKDFQERNPDWSRNNSSPDSTGIAVWEEARRARESEARLAKACKGLLFWGKPGVTFGDPSIARDEAEAALKAAEDGTP